MANLFKIRSIRQYLDESACELAVLNMVITHLDYANSLLFGLPASDIKRLQRVQNMAAKLVLRRRKYDSATAALKELHWVPIRYRIQSKLR